MNQGTHHFLPRVLLVSDRPEVRAFVCNGLPPHSFDLIEQHDAGDLADFVEWAEPDVILLGLQEPSRVRAAYRSLCRASARHRLAIALIGQSVAGQAHNDDARLQDATAISPPFAKAKSLGPTLLALRQEDLLAFTCAASRDNPPERRQLQRGRS